MDSIPPGSSVHGTSQARILEWVAAPFSRGSSQPRDWTWVSGTAGRFFIIWATGKPPEAVQRLFRAWQAQDQGTANVLIWVQRQGKNTNVLAQRQSGRRNSFLLSLGLVRPSPDWTRPTLQRAIRFSQATGSNVHLPQKHLHGHTQSNTSIVFQILSPFGRQFPSTEMADPREHWDSHLHR